MGKHFEKLISSQVFDEKRVCKVGKPCLFTSCVGEPRVGRAKSRELFKARAISHFLVTRLRAVKKLYEATLRVTASKDRAKLEIDPKIKILRFCQNKAYHKPD